MALWSRQGAASGWRGQQHGEALGGLGAFRRELAVGDSDGPPAGDLEDDVSLAVGLERLAVGR